MECIGRFVGSRHHNQFKPCIKVLNAADSLVAFITFWEGRKIDKKPNQMFTANKKALSCPRTRFELYVIGLLYSLLVGPMISVMAGQLGNVTTNLGLIPIIAQLLQALEHPDDDLLRKLIRGECLLIPAFQEPVAEEACSPSPLAVLGQLTICRIAVFLTDPERDFVLTGVKSITYLRFKTTCALSFEQKSQLEDAVVDCLVRVFPLMAKKLRDWQPNLCPGGDYTNLLAEEVKTLGASTTSDIMEGGLGIGDHYLLGNPSMLVRQAPKSKFGGISCFHGISRYHAKLYDSMCD